MIFDIICEGFEREEVIKSGVGGGEGERERVMEQANILEITSV